MRPIILAGDVSSAGAPEVGSYDAALEGAEVRVDGVRRGALPGAVTVSPGRHRLMLLKGGSTLLERTVDFRDGERIDAASLLRRPRSVALDIHVGVLSLSSGDPQRQVASPVPFVGLGLRVNDALGPLDALAEVGGTRFEAFIAPDGTNVPLVLSVIRAGAGLQWPLKVGRLRLGLGPVASLAYLSREFRAGARDGVTLFIPGACADARLRLTQEVEATLAARGSYAMASVDGVTTHLGGFSIWAGVGWRPW